MWEEHQKFEQSHHAELYAILYNTANGIGFKAPDGKHWTREMFLPGYRRPEETQEYDWKRQRELMGRIGKPPDRKKLKADTAARASTQDRFRQAEAAKKRGATRQEIRLILEA